MNAEFLAGIRGVAELLSGEGTEMTPEKQLAAERFSRKFSRLLQESYASGCDQEIFSRVIQLCEGQEHVLFMRNDELILVYLHGMGVKLTEVGWFRRRKYARIRGVCGENEVLRLALASQFRGFLVEVLGILGELDA